MRRALLLAATAAACAATAAPASAKVLELGSADAKPTCPSTPCLAVSRTTGYQAEIGKATGRYVVPADGRIVAWTIALGKPTSDQVTFFDSHLGGAAKASITVMKPGKKLRRRVMVQSPLQALQPYFGQTVQFPLASTLAVRKGWVVGLTVPTWAPALTTLTGDGSFWRASRPSKKCAKTGTQTAQTAIGDLAQYRCYYKARLTYSATLITSPAPTSRASAAR